MAWGRLAQLGAVGRGTQASRAFPGGPDQQAAKGWADLGDRSAHPSDPGGCHVDQHPLHGHHRNPRLGRPAGRPHPLAGRAHPRGDGPRPPGGGARSGRDPPGDPHRGGLGPGGPRRHRPGGHPLPGEPGNPDRPGRPLGPGPPGRWPGGVGLQPGGGRPLPEAHHRQPGVGVLRGGLGPLILVLLRGQRRPADRGGALGLLPGRQREHPPGRPAERGPAGPGPPAHGRCGPQDPPAGSELPGRCLRSHGGASAPQRPPSPPPGGRRAGPAGPGTGARPASTSTWKTSRRKTGGPSPPSSRSWPPAFTRRAWSSPWPCRARPWTGRATPGPAPSTTRPWRPTWTGWCS